MIDLARIAPIDPRERRFGELGFDLHHDRGALRGPVRGLSQQLEGAFEVRRVLLAQGDRRGVALQVVVAIRQAEPAGRNDRDALRGVAGILLAAEAEEHSAASEAGVQPAEERGDRLGVRDLVDRPHVGADRIEPGLVDLRQIHAGSEVIPELAQLGIGGAGVARRLFEEPPEELLVLVVELAVDAPARLVGRDRVLRPPAVAGVGVEVDTGIDRPVHESGLEARRVRQLGERARSSAGCRGCGWGGNGSAGQCRRRRGRRRESCRGNRSLWSLWSQRRQWIRASGEERRAESAQRQRREKRRSTPGFEHQFAALTANPTATFSQRISTRSPAAAYSRVSTMS